MKNEEKLRYWAECVLEGLQHIHSKGIIHCDLKLENVLMCSPKEPDEYLIPKICDFGLSHLITRESDGKGYMEVLCGTKGYLAPEQKAVSPFFL